MPSSTQPSRELSPSRPVVRATSTSRNGSRASSRARYSRSPSRASAAYVPAPETLLLPDGPIGEETAELLHELVNPDYREREGPLFAAADDEGSSDGESDAESAELRHTLPWYKRPSPVWFLVAVPLVAAGASATLAPRVEILTRIICEVYKPEYTIGRGNDTTISLLGSGPFTSIDERQLCAADPVVQAEVAKLNLVMTASLGLLSCLTTAWWGALSDRFGRTRIIGCCLFGLLMTDISFLVVSQYHTVLPGGYWFILLGPLLDGMLGGHTALAAASNAYFADCTDPEYRSRVFSLALGLMFIGIGLGPAFGSVVIHLTGSPLSVFLIATAQHMVFVPFVLLFLPESLSPRRMLEARRRHEDSLRLAREAPKKHRLLSSFGALFSFLTPLSLFYSSQQPGSGSEKRSTQNLSLVFVAIGYGLTLSIYGSYNYKFQYISAVYGWSSEEIGYWLTIVGFTRAFFLTAILPLIIKLLKPRPKAPIQLPVELEEPLQSDTPRYLEPSKPTSASNSSTHALTFDLWLARSALFIDVISYVLLTFAPDAMFFTGAAMLGACGSGFGPAIQSVALGLYTQGGGVESGKLFGALSVIQALSSQVIGPALFGFTYMSTVATFPSTMFLVAAGILCVSLLSVSLVRLPKETVEDVETLAIVPEAGAQEDELEDTEIPTIVVEEINSKPSSPRVDV